MRLTIGGTGETKALASAVGKVFAKRKETAGGKGETPSAEIDPAQSSWGLRAALDGTATRLGAR
jgi:hypothetical protein